MFEKSLYDLIRGLRGHKGVEREYIQSTIRECRNEVRSSDMDLKATALLKLVYLEMFGHDMSWASFHVLEVMSSSKYPQKRVGYLAAVQSFRPDTEVLMLATNMLKKDISSVSIPTISLPLITIPHIITPSLAISILPDLLPRLSHSSASVRKKTIVTLYRLALSHPETLRPSWPKIKERLMDDTEDSSVTAAVMNVVCELGWRRPHDFLPLAPRLFDLLVDGRNNWMAIKIIKLFATLTPLEPRLVKKLLPPLVNLIKTTPAMSLLYECISGIIQGGILEGQDANRERDEVAELCVGKLRGMIAVDGDPNLRYVALLAFNRIVSSHPEIVAMHQDVILECIDDPDISIRLQALQLGSGMISSDNLQGMVERLMRQLRDACRSVDTQNEVNRLTEAIEPAADSDSEDAEVALQHNTSKPDKMQALPNEYRLKMIKQILDMCSKDTYANIVDFEWYVDILVDLIHVLPTDVGSPISPNALISNNSVDTETVVAAIGMELRTVAVRVLSIRSYAVQAATSLLIANGKPSKPATRSSIAAPSVLELAAWVVGEYSHLLSSPRRTLEALLLQHNGFGHPRVLCAYLQAIPKILSTIFTEGKYRWTAELQAETSLLLARVVDYMEASIEHPYLEVQERCVEFLELMRLSKEAVESYDANSSTGPLILSEMIPSLFNSQDLNPVAFSAQKKVPLPREIDLTISINTNLTELLEGIEFDSLPPIGDFNLKDLYYQQVGPTAIKAASGTLPDTGRFSYQNENEDPPSDAMTVNQVDRRERSRDHPFYIVANEPSSGDLPTSLHEILKVSNGQDFEIDSIPIMNLEISDPNAKSFVPPSIRQKKQRQDVFVAAEETLDNEIDDELKPPSDRLLNEVSGLRPVRPGGRRVLLQVDSSGLGNLSLDDNATTKNSIQDKNHRPFVEEDEMAKALIDVERIRRELQRASERVNISDEISADGLLVKRKKKKSQKTLVENSELSSTAGMEEGQGTRAYSMDTGGDSFVKRKKKKKKKITEPAITE